MGSATSTLTMPRLAAKKTSFLFTAGEEECPQEPAMVPAPPRASVLAEWMKVPRLATEPVVMEKLEITRGASKFTAPPWLSKVRLLTTSGKPMPVFWAALPL